MKKDNIIRLGVNKSNPHPPIVKRLNTKAVHIPVLERIYKINGELYYQAEGDDRPRKWKDYSLKHFN